MHTQHANSISLGFTLVELQIALTLSVLSLLGLCRFHAALFISNYQTQQYHRANDAADLVLTIMQRELMRAGFIQKVSDSDPNPFIYSSGALFQTNSEKNCITYRYDRNKNGVLDGEFFGFKLQNNAIRMSKGNAQDCSYLSGWESISDSSSMKVVTLNFTLERFSRDALNQTQTYITLNMDIESKLVPDLKFNFKRNVLTRVSW